MANIIGSAYVRIRALTNDIEKDIKKSLGKQLDGLGKEIGDSVSKSISDGLKGVKINAEDMIDTSGADAAAKKVVDDVQGALDDIDTKLEIDVEASRVAIDKAKHDIEEVIDEYDGEDVELTPSVSAPASRYVTTRLSWLARTRFVKFVTQIDSKSFATVLAALSGARAIGQSLNSIWDAFKNIDRNILKIGTLATALVYAGGAVTALVSNVSSLAYGLLQISGIAAPLVGIIGGVAFGMGALVAAMKDAPVYLQDVGAAFSDIQDSISGAFWSRAAEPIRELVNTLLPELQSGLTDTGSALGQFFGSLSDSLGSNLVDSVTEMFDNLVWSIQIAQHSTDDMASSLDILGRHGSEYLPRMADWWVRINDQFNNFLTRAEADGSLQRWTETAIDNLSAVGDVLKGAVRILWEFGSAAAEAGGSTLQALGDGLNNIADIVSRDPFRTTLVSVLRSAHSLLDDISRSSGPAVEGFFLRLGGTVVSTFESVGDSIGTVIENLFTALSSNAIQGGITNLLQGLTTGLAGFSEYLPSIAEGLGALLSTVGVLGESLLPVLGSALSGVSDIVVTLAPTLQILVGAFSSALGIFTSLPGPIQAVAAAFLLMKIPAVSTAIATLTTNFGRLRGVLSTNIFGAYRTNLQRVTTETGGVVTNTGRLSAASATARGAVSTLGTALKGAFLASGVGLAIALIVTVISEIAGASAEAKAAIESYRATFDTFGNTTEATMDTIDAAIANFSGSWKDDIGALGKSGVEMLQNMGISADEFRQAVLGNADALASVQAKMDAFQENDNWWGGNADQVTAVNRLLEEQQEALQGAADAQDYLGTTTETTADATQTLIDTYGEAAAQLDIQINSLEELIRLREEEAGTARDAVSGYIGLLDAMDKMADLGKETGDVWDDSLTLLENLRDNSDLRGPVEQLGKVAEAAVDAALGLADAGYSTEEVQSAMADARQSFLDAADAMGIPREEAEALALSYGLIPTDIFTNVNADTETAYAQLNGLLLEIDSSSGTIMYNGDSYNARVTLGELIGNVDEATGTVDIDGNSFPAEMTLAELIESTGNTELMALFGIEPTEDPQTTVNNAFNGVRPPNVPFIPELQNPQQAVNDAVTGVTGEVMVIPEMEEARVQGILDGMNQPSLSVQPTLQPNGGVVLQSQLSTQTFNVPVGPQLDTAQARSYLARTLATIEKPEVEIEADTSSAESTLVGFAGPGGMVGRTVPPRITLSADNKAATLTLKATNDAVLKTKPNITIGAVDRPASTGLETLRKRVEETKPKITMGAINAPANTELASLRKRVEGTKPKITVGATTSAGTSAVTTLVSNTNKKSARISVSASTSNATKAVSAFVWATNRKSATVTVYTKQVKSSNSANGNIFSGAETFANGGVRMGENHRAMLARANGNFRIWAEPETGGEAYIPLAKSKRKRSLDLWKTVGKMFGMLPKSFANGGIESTAASAYSSSEAVSTTSVTNVYNVTIDANSLQGLKTVEQMTQMFRVNARQGREAVI